MITAMCQRGHQVMVAEANLGAPVRCPVCLEVFLVPANAATPSVPSVTPTEPRGEPESGLDELPVVVFDGLAFTVSGSYGEFCRGVAEGEPQAIEIELADYSRERVALAEVYRTGHGESVEAMRQFQRASLGCCRCGKSMSEAFIRSLATDQPTGAPIGCQNCGSSRAYLLVIPDLAELPAPTSSGPPRRKAARRKQAAAPRTTQTMQSTDSQAARRTAAWGVTFHLTRHILQLLVIFLFATRAIVDPETVLDVLGLVLGAAIACGVLGVIGSILCARIPDDPLAAGWSVLSLGLDALGVLCGVVNAILLNPDPTDRGFNALLAILMGVLAMGGWAAFMGFLAQVAISSDMEAEAGRARTLILHAVWLVIAPIVIVPIALGMLTSEPTFARIAAGFIFLVMMAWFATGCWFAFASVAICVTVRQRLAGKTTGDAHPARDRSRRTGARDMGPQSRIMLVKTRSPGRPTCPSPRNAPTATG